MTMTMMINDDGTGGGNTSIGAHSTPDPDLPPKENDPVPEEVPEPDPPPVREPETIPHQVPIRTARRSCTIEAA